MSKQQKIKLGQLLLDQSNYRHDKQKSEKDAILAMIADQGKRLVVLAKDIIEHGTNPSDLPIVYASSNGHTTFVVAEGNRRITALKLMLTPDLASGTNVHSAFKRLHAAHVQQVPKTLDCVVVANRDDAQHWIEIKHTSGLDGAGTESWSSIAKARSDLGNGFTRPDLDVLNFVLDSTSLDDEIRKLLNGSKFSITNLNRLIASPEFRSAIGLDLRRGRVTSLSKRDWLRDVLTDVVSIIATGLHNGQKFTERTIGKPEKIAQFAQEVLQSHPRRPSVGTEWKVAGGQASTSTAKASAIPGPGRKLTDRTKDRKTLIPKQFKISLPSGKINDIFHELQRIDVTEHPNSVSVMFRVFLEFSLEHYIKKENIALPLKHNGKLDDSFATKLRLVKEDMTKKNLLNSKDLKPIDQAVSNRGSPLSSETLNAYVHNSNMNPSSETLKTSWNDVQYFVEKIWV